MSDREKGTVLPSLAASLALVVLPCLRRAPLGKLVEDVSSESWISGSAARMEPPFAHPATPKHRKTNLLRTELSPKSRCFFFPEKKTILQMQQWK